MGRALKFALILALPIEVANLLFFGIPVGVGMPDNSHWYSQILGNLWFYLNVPSIVASGHLAFFKSNPSLTAVLLFVSGYLATALLLLAAILCLQALRFLVRTHILRRA